MPSLRPISGCVSPSSSAARQHARLRARTVSLRRSFERISFGSTDLNPLTQSKIDSNVNPCVRIRQRRYTLHYLPFDIATENR